MQGVCRQDTGFVIFCNAALPGERLFAQITAVKKGERALYSTFATMLTRAYLGLAMASEL